MRQLKIVVQPTHRTPVTERFLSEINKVSSLITPEEEIELAKKIRAGDKKAEEKLIKANLRFLVSVSKQYLSSGIPLGDLIGYGSLGLIKSANRFDETRGFKFISYAVWWIRQSILEGISNDSRTIRIPTNKIGDLRKLKNCSDKLEQLLQRSPTLEEIQEELQMPTTQFNQLIHGDVKMSSIDRRISDDETATFADIMPDNSNETFNAVFRNPSLKTDLHRLLNTLSQKESTIICQYYGIDLNGNYQEPITLEEIGKQLGLTKERVRQLRDKTLKRLKNNSNIKLMREYLN